MAYKLDSYDQSLVVDGWQNGIADSPYDGISDIRNCAIGSSPGEVSVTFSTGSLSAVIAAGTVTGFTTGTTILFSGAANIEGGMAISFGTVSNFSGITAGTTVYWVQNVVAGAFSLYSDFPSTSIVTVSGSGNAGFTVHAPDFTNYQGIMPNRVARTLTGNTFMQDSKGKVWTNKRVTGVHNYWEYIGNAPHSGSFIGDNSNGNGLVAYETSAGAHYVFIFSDKSIDYFKDDATNAIVYGWNPTTGSAGSNLILNAGANSGASHDCLVGQDNVVYYCDASFVGSFYEKSGQAFDPTNTATYTPNSQALGIPTIDTALCLAELGVNLLVGGTRNLIYPWNRTGTVSGNSILNSYSYPIWLSESVVQKMVTVNSNAYIFAGNRGRIHITNGTQAQIWQKIPDHLSGTVDPYYVWGAAVYHKNYLYFSIAATNNSGTANATYGGIWSIDLSNQALRLTNQLSYGTYAGLATALFAITPLYNGGALVGNAVGAGLYIGWCSGNVQSSGQGTVFSGGSSGIDGTVSTPYTGSQSYVDTDLIPIGTFDKARTFTRIQYLLTKPLVAGESITLQYRTDFSQSYTTIATDSTAGNYTNGFPTNWTWSQWIQLRIILNSTASSPSYVRLKHIRLTGLVGPSLANQQQITQ